MEAGAGTVDFRGRPFPGREAGVEDSCPLAGLAEVSSRTLPPKDDSCGDQIGDIPGGAPGGNAPGGPPPGALNGGAPPGGKGKCGGKPWPGWFCGSMGFAWAWPSAA